MKMNLFEFFFKLVRKISSRVKGDVAQPAVSCGVDAPVLGGYRDEAFNTPLTEERTPLRSAFRKPPEYYAKMHRDAVSLYDNSPCKGDAELIYACRVHAHWGLIYAGQSAIPHAIEMLKSAVSEAREDGAGILGNIGKDDKIVETLLASLQKEVEIVTRDSLILALGQLRNRKVIPALASIINDMDADGDTRHLAAYSLGRIVRRRFDKDADPIGAAMAWLEKHPEEC